MKENKQKSVRKDRVAIVNKLIVKISQTSRGFLKYKNTFGRVVIRKNNRLWYIDQYTGKYIYFHQAPYHGFKGFTAGGTLKDMVFSEFKRFIMTGPVSSSYTHMNAQYWGIPDDEIKELKRYALEIGYLKI